MKYTYTQIYYWWLAVVFITLAFSFALADVWALIAFICFMFSIQAIEATGLKKRSILLAVKTKLIAKNIELVKSATTYQEVRNADVYLDLYVKAIDKMLKE